MVFSRLYRMQYDKLLASYCHLSMCLSVTLYIAAEVSEPVNRKCTIGTQFYNFQPPTSTLFPQPLHPQNLAWYCCLSICLSVTLCIAAEVSEQVNRKCTIGTQFYNFQPPTTTHSLNLSTPRIWRDIVVCLYVHISLCPSVTVRIGETIHPTAKVCEQVNRKCLPRNMILQLSTPYTDPIPPNSPALEP